MTYTEYETNLTPLCPVAIRIGQLKVHAPDHDTWEVVSCEQCEDKFAIGPNRIFGSRRTSEACVAQLKALLKTHHQRNESHADSYEFAD